jgi:alpha-glucosidase
VQSVSCFVLTYVRLHVKIFDTNNTQFTIPDAVVSLAKPNKTSTKAKSDLVFNHNPSPFAFWITRRSDPDGPPLFDTRISSLPQTPIPPVIPTDNSTALDGFPLVFEDQYLQVPHLVVFFTVKANVPLSLPCL